MIPSSFPRRRAVLAALLVTLGATACQPVEQVDSRLQRVVLEVPVGERGESTEQQIGEAEASEPQTEDEVDQ